MMSLLNSHRSTRPARGSRPRAVYRRTPKTGRARAIFAVANLAFLLLLYLAENLVGERHWLTTLLAYAPQHLFAIPTVILLGWAAIKRDRRAVGLNLLAAAFFLFALLGFNLPVRLPGKPKGIPIRVMTYNIHHCEAGGIRVAEAVREQNPDIVCMQETIPLLNWSNAVNEISRCLPGWRLANYGQMATFSRYPIVTQRFHEPLPKQWRGFLQTTISVRGRRVTVLNVHFQAGAGHSSISHRKVSLRHYVRSMARVRSAQTAYLARLGVSFEEPVIIMGDFNTPPRGRLYHRISRRFTDTFGAVGWGTGQTFRRGLPVLRIDYIFLSKGLRPIRCFVPRAEASDHRPIVADVVL